MRTLFAALTFLSAVPASPAFAAPPIPPSLTNLPAVELSTLLRGLLLANLPDPLVQKDLNWGAMREVPVGLKWHREGILLKPEVQRKLHNDGVWRRVRVTADAPGKRLRLGVEKVAVPAEGRLTFVLNVVQPVNVLFEQQLWRAGDRLYSGSTRARCTVGIRLWVESLSRFEKSPDSFLPDLVFRVRVTDARVAYNDVVVEHTLGVGGDAARLLGDAFLDTLKQWKPSLERDLLVKANRAIVKAGDTKEVRISLGKLLQGQKPVGTKK